jgi:hypothetical protein
MLRPRRLGTTFASLGIFVAAMQPAHALTVDVEFTANSFVARTSYWLTHEAVPQDEVSGAFHVVTDVPPDPDGNPGDRVTDVYLNPVDGELSIAGFEYTPADLTAYVGYRETFLEMLQIGGSGPPGAFIGNEPPGTVPFTNEGPPGPAVHVSTSGTHDFALVVVWDELGNLLGPGATPGEPLFAYTTATTVSGFWPAVLTITASIDGGVPQQITIANELPDPTICEGASPEGPPVWNGRWLCYPPVDSGEEEGARAAGGSTLRLRDVAVAGAKRGRGPVTGQATVKTGLGTLTVATRAIDRTLLRANEGLTPAVEPPADADTGTLDCAPAKIVKGTVRFRPIRNALAGDQQYRVSGPSRLCTDPSGAGGDLLCYRARLEKRKPRAHSADVWIAHALGTEQLRLARNREICLPAELL